MDRKLLLVIIICCWFVNGFTQGYKPFPESNAYWIEEHGQLQTGSCGFEYKNCTDPVYFGNDTVINSVIYHTLLYRQVCSIQWVNGNPPPPPPCQYMRYYNVPPARFAHLRQDSVAKKVYIYDWVNNQDTLLYDFNLSVGSPLPHTYNNPNYPNVIVISMDSILLSDGYHKRYNLDVGVSLDSAYIIEGVGSTFGLLTPLIGHFENNDGLLCFSQNNVTIYPDTSTLCDLTVGIPSEENAQVLSIYPNPTDDLIHIHNHFTAPIMVSIFSSYGSVLYNTTLAKDAHEIIDLSEFSDGIYFIRAMSGKHIVSEKVVKY